MGIDHALEGRKKNQGNAFGIKAARQASKHRHHCGKISEQAL